MNIAREAEKIIQGERREEYGPVQESFVRISELWSALLNYTITPQQVALLMIALKLHREANRPKADNRVDIIGYTLLLDQLQDEDSTK